MDEANLKTCESLGVKQYASKFFQAAQVKRRTQDDYKASEILWD